MADTTELKTYVIKVESNLDDYAKEAIKAEKAASDLKTANEELAKTATPEQMKIANAELKVRNDEYKKAEALLKNAVAVVKAETGSRKQLELAIRLGRQELGKMPEMYIKEANSLKTIINPAYTTHIQKLAALTSMQIKYDQTIKDGRSNVGNYASSLQGLGGIFSAIPGPIGNAASSGQRFIATLAKIGPVGALIGGGLLAISAPLIAFFTKSERGIELLERKVAGFKAAISVLTGELISAGDKMVNALEEPEKKTKSFWAWVGSAMGPAWISTGIAMDAASKAAENYTQKMQDLEDQERAMIVPRAEANMKIKEARLLFADETKTINERIAALQFALDLENETADKEIEHQKKITAVIKENNEEKKKTLTIRDSDLKKLEEAKAKEIDLLTESMGRQIRVAKTIASARAEILKQESDEIKAFFDEWERETLLDIKIRDDLRKKSAKEDADFFAEWEKDTLDSIASLNKKKEAAFNDMMMGFEVERGDAGINVDKLQSILDREYQAMITSVEYDRIGANEKLLIDQEYTARKKELSDLRIQQATQELDLVGGLLGSFSQLFGKQTVAQKALSVAQALISTYTAGVKAMAELPLGSGPVLRFLTLAAVIAAGMVQVRNILAVKVPGSAGGAGSSPSAISSSAPAQRTYAQPAGSTVLTQPQLTQPQLNALPSGNLLTAADIAAAMKGIPAPIVTVEDINARQASVKRVTVKANI